MTKLFCYGAEFAPRRKRNYPTAANCRGAALFKDDRGYFQVNEEDTPAGGEDGGKTIESPDCGRRGDQPFPAVGHAERRI